MKYMFFSVTMMAGLLLLISGCHTHEHTDDGGHSHSHGDDSHSHDTNEPEPLSYTKWTDNIELFVEFPPLIVGSESRFAAHFTKMVNYKPIVEGSAKVFLLENVREIINDVSEAPSSPGIFRLGLSPSKAGIFDLGFVLNTPQINDTIIIKKVAVYPDVQEALAANPAQPEGDEISFLKEQAWKIEFGISEVVKREINNIIHTSGEIQPVKGEEKIISAKSSGIVIFNNSLIQEGKSIRAGESLFTINSRGLVNANLEEKYSVANAKMEKAKANFERAKELIAEQIIGQKEFENRKMELAVAEAELKTLSAAFNENGQSVASPMTGIVKSLMVSDGQYVQEGTPLIKITNNRRLILRAEVSQKHLPQLPLIRSANFKTPYQEEVQSIDDYNGRLISYGQVVEQGEKFLPVLFELDNIQNLIPGSYVELFLMTDPRADVLVIPNSAIMQDYSAKYVYVEIAGESFEKREVKLGITDGVHTEVISGLDEGEWIVTKGAYQIKMASMSSAIPAHGHTH